MQKKTIFIGIALFWVAVFAVFIGMKEYTLQTGQQVLLKTVPVDPRDFFRGDYVILRYEITQIDTEKVISYVTGPSLGSEVYIKLEKVGEYAEPVLVSPLPPKEELFIKGKITGVRNDRLTVEYGIESYFVPEGAGKVIERERAEEVDVRVAIDEKGNAGIVDLLIRGEVVEFGE